MRPLVALIYSVHHSNPLCSFSHRYLYGDKTVARVTCKQIIGSWIAENHVM